VDILLSFIVFPPKRKIPEEKSSGAIKMRARKTYGLLHLLPSRLYCRSRNHTGSCLSARGLYRRSGITPCPEDACIIAGETKFDKPHFTVYTELAYKNALKCRRTV
jgi:hypothetical protein